MKASPFTCGIEALEVRQLLSGNVTVFLRHGDLVFRGDKQDNQVVISSPSPGTVRVEGLDETTVGGKAFADFAANLRNLLITSLQGGADEIAVRGAIDIGGNVLAKLGDEGEFVVEGTDGPVNIAGNLTVQGGDEVNVALRNEVHVNGNVSVHVGGSVSAAAGVAFLADFEAATFSHSLQIDNPYFPLIPGATLTYEETSIDEETGEEVVATVVVEVLNETKTILGIEARVVSDIVSIDGHVVEKTSDYHAQDDNGNVWYMGEDTEEFELDDEGNVISSSHAGAWLAGVDGARPGIIMLAKPAVGDRYYQERQANNALDQGEVLAVDDTLSISIGDFTNVVRTKDTTVTEPDALETKQYVPGLGLAAGSDVDPATGETTATLTLISAKLNGKDITELVSPTGFTGVNATGVLTEPLKVDGRTFIRTHGPVVLSEVRLAEHVQIISKAEVTILESVFNSDSTITARDTLAMHQSTFAGAMAIRGDFDLFVNGSSFGDTVTIRFGLGDNTLSVGNSTFTDLLADGWRGENEFDDQGGNVFGNLELTGFGD